MIDCGNCGHPKRCVAMDRCIMGKMPPADAGPSREQKPRNVNTSKGNVLMKGDKPVETAVKKVKKKAK
jgi:hypothetical protein